jgi:lipoprotein-anchoring transpeptidase ErfK/SrfK
MRAGPSRRAFLLSLPAAGAAAAGLAGCAPKSGSAAGASPTAGRSAAPATVSLTAAQSVPAGTGAGVVVGPVPRLTAAVTGGSLSGITVVGPDGAAVPGAATDAAWTPSAPLALGTTYTATATATGKGGAAPATSSLALTVVAEDAAVRAKMMPLDGETVGVGMPIVVTFTAAVPQELRSAVTDAIVLDTGGVEGAWRWTAADSVHWRPKDYWPAGTKVRVQVPLTQLQIGTGRFGAADRDVSFTIGDAHISTADTVTHQMTTTVNGQVVKVTPISAGREDSDPAFVTRSGPHLVLEKHADYLMDGRTVGQDYQTQVKWATRIANSGEFVHGAPWSVPQQGHANVSHGCLNVSDANAKWFYDLSRRGDVVQVTGTDRPLELTNGLGDWTLSWEQWTSA